MAASREVLERPHDDFPSDRVKVGKNTTRRCVFCGDQGVTREHVIPRWVFEELKREYSTSQQFEHSSGDGETIEFQWRSSTIDFTVKRVCRACNTGWMNSALEQPCIPLVSSMLRNLKTTISRDDCRILAAWAYKILAMALFRHRGQLTLASPHLADLYRHHRAPVEAAVFLSCYGSAVDSLVDGYTQHLVLSPVMALKLEPSSEAISAEILKLRLNRLLISCIVGSSNKTLARPTLTSDRVLTIWPLPSQEAVEWPPPQALDSEQEWRALTHYLIHS